MTPSDIETSIEALHLIVDDLSKASEALRKVDRQRRIQVAVLTAMSVCTLLLVAGLALSFKRSVDNRSDIDTILAVRHERCLLLNENSERQHQLWVDIITASEKNRQPPTDPAKLAEYDRLVSEAHKPLTC